MKKLVKNLSFVAVLAVASNASAALHTVEGKIAKVVPSETEIYVTSDADQKKYEYYFDKDTQVLRNGAPVDFAELKKGQRVKVLAQKKGKRLDPERVEILE